MKPLFLEVECRGFDSYETTKLWMQEVGLEYQHQIQHQDPCQEGQKVEDPAWSTFT